MTEEIQTRVAERAAALPLEAQRALGVLATRNPQGMFFLADERGSVKMLFGTDLLSTTCGSDGAQSSAELFGPEWLEGTVRCFLAENQALFMQGASAATFDWVKYAGSHDGQFEGEKIAVLEQYHAGVPVRPGPIKAFFIQGRLKQISGSIRDVRSFPGRNARAHDALLADTSAAAELTLAERETYFDAERGRFIVAAISSDGQRYLIDEETGEVADKYPEYSEWSTVQRQTKGYAYPHVPSGDTTPNPPPFACDFPTSGATYSPSPSTPQLTNATIACTPYTGWAWAMTNSAYAYAADMAVSNWTVYDFIASVNGRYWQFLVDYSYLDSNSCGRVNSTLAHHCVGWVERCTTGHRFPGSPFGSEFSAKVGFTEGESSENGYAGGSDSTASNGAYLMMTTSVLQLARFYFNNNDGLGVYRDINMVVKGSGLRALQYRIDGGLWTAPTAAGESFNSLSTSTWARKRLDSISPTAGSHTLEIRQTFGSALKIDAVFIAPEGIRSCDYPAE